MLTRVEKGAAENDPITKEDRARISRAYRSFSCQGEITNEKKGDKVVFYLASILSHSAMLTCFEHHRKQPPGDNRSRSSF